MWGDFLKIILYIKRELRCSELKYALIYSVINISLGILSAFLGGSPFIYRILLLPRFAPPAFVFVLVWSVVYVALGFAAGLVYPGCSRCSGTCRRKISSLVPYFLLQLFMFLWYPFFFGADMFFIALVDIALIGICAFFTIKKFSKINVISSLIVSAVLLWIIFCFVLNFCVIILN